MRLPPSSQNAGQRAATDVDLVAARFTPEHDAVAQVRTIAGCRRSQALAIDQMRGSGRGDAEHAGEALTGRAIVGGLRSAQLYRAGLVQRERFDLSPLEQDAAAIARLAVRLVGPFGRRAAETTESAGPARSGATRSD